jgi:hypothetical protein
MAILLKSLGWFLILVAAIVIVYPLFCPLIKYDPLINTLPSAVLVALGAQLLAQGKNFSDVLEKRSLFYLESCIKAYEEARNLLQDGNNERVKWIAAGRALAHAQELANGITEDDHRRVLELHNLKYRGFFHSVLADKPAAFFFGAKDTSTTTDEAAKLSTAGEVRGGRSITSTVKEISEKSLRVVWKAAQWPENYNDPLDTGFTDEEQANLLVLFPGLHEFLEYKKRWSSASGKLYPEESKK